MSALSQYFTMQDVVAITSGRQELWVPVDRMFLVSAGWASAAAPASFNVTNFFSPIRYIAFDGATDETAYAEIAFPKRWNRGTLTFQPYWRTSTTGVGTVQWGLGARALSDDDPSGTYSIIYSEDTANGTQYDQHIGPESAAVTVQGSPAVGDKISLLFIRNSGADTNTVDAWLEGYKIFWTSDAPTDD